MTSSPTEAEVYGEAYERGLHFGLTNPTAILGEVNNAFDDDVLTLSYERFVGYVSGLAAAANKIAHGDVDG